MIVYRLKEVEKILKVSRPTLKSIIDKGELKTIKLTDNGWQMVIDEELQRFLNTKIKG